MIIRVDKTANYSIISNAILRDTRLSFKARGLAAYLLTMPNDWQINREHLAKQSPDGIASVRSALKELRDKGYITSERGQNEQGKFAWVTVLHESPVVVAENEPALPREVAENRPPQGVVMAGKPPAQKPPSQNRRLLSTEVPKTEEPKTTAEGNVRACGSAAAAAAPPAPSKPTPVEVYVEESKKKPNHVQADMIDYEVRDVDKWRGVVKSWLAKGCKPTNIEGMLDVYRNGWRNERHEQRAERSAPYQQPRTPAAGRPEEAAYHADVARRYPFPAVRAV